MRLAYAWQTYSKRCFKYPLKPACSQTFALPPNCDAGVVRFACVFVQVSASRDNASSIQQTRMHFTRFLPLSFPISAGVCPKLNATSLGFRFAHGLHLI